MFPITPDGNVEPSKVAVFSDMSGSALWEFSNRCVSMLAAEPNIDATFYVFNTSVALASDDFRTGGYGDFQCVTDFVEEMEDAPDFVLVITDGVGPSIVPTNPEKWIWIIEPGGAEVPKASGRSFRALD
jgi:predicted metal-dependent peptidase